ncbi:MAG: methionine gamma-lyase family protein [Clostridia bacterium]|nr:methionine gamma-lyase family protein [Clostridia bacterium]
MENLYRDFGISDGVWEIGERLIPTLAERFAEIDANAEFNQAKVIGAFRRCRVRTACLTASTGYGYDDIGRDTLEEVYADIFKSEAALVRPQITCGTHALTTALFAVLRPGDELISAVGAPYDTLEEVIGVRPSVGSLAEFGVSYKKIELKENGAPDIPLLVSSITDKTKLITIQRSKGYATRPTLSVAEIGEIIAAVKAVRSDILCMVDNCYGEFTERIEPTEVGADMCVGSLIKNPGGGLAPSGGYIAGTEYCIERCAAWLNAPGLGREVGANLGTLPAMYQGLFLAPSVVANAVKGAVFAARVYEEFGYNCVPKSNESRHDIIQCVELGSREAMLAFCRGIQSAAPVDAYVTPVAAPMPGYDSEVVMAAGTFIQGSSIELSADGPLREPFAVYFQGGLTWQHAKLGVLSSLQAMADDGLIPELGQAF